MITNTIRLLSNPAPQAYLSAGRRMWAFWVLGKIMFLNIKKNYSPRFSSRELIISSIVVLICLVLSITFPSSNVFQDLTKNLFFLVIIPALFIKLILKKKLNDFGISLGDWKKGVAWSNAMLMVNIVIFYLIINFTSFKNNYQLSAYVIDSFWYFIFYELVLINLFLAAQEFFYHGFILFAASAKLRSWAIIIPVAFLAGVLLISESSFYQFLPFLLLVLTGGIVACKSRSLIYSYLGSLVFMIILDGYLIYALK